MKTFDYEKYYLDKQMINNHFEKYISSTKAEKINKLLKDKEIFSLIEVGTGQGHLLNSLYNIKIKIGLDISFEAIKQHKDNYFAENNIYCPELSPKDIDNYYYNFFTSKDISGLFENKKIWKDLERNTFLIQLDADRGLPFEDKSVEIVVLCDILEHVIDPVKLLNEAKRVGVKIIVKIPIENALLPKLSLIVNGIKYAVNHPAGHLFCWNYKQIIKLINQANLNIESFKLYSFNYDTSENKYFVKFVIIKFIELLNSFFKTEKISLYFLGGDFFAVLY